MGLVPDLGMDLRLRAAKIMNYLAQVHAMKRELIRCCSEFYPSIVESVERALECSQPESIEKELEEKLKTVQLGQDKKFNERCKGVVEGYEALKEHIGQIDIPNLGPYTENAQTSPTKAAKAPPPQTESSNKDQKRDKGRWCFVS